MEAFLNLARDVEQNGLLAASEAATDDALPDGHLDWLHEQLMNNTVPAPQLVPQLLEPVEAQQLGQHLPVPPVEAQQLGQHLPVPSGFPASFGPQVPELVPGFAASFSEVSSGAAASLHGWTSRRFS